MCKLHPLARSKATYLAMPTRNSLIIYGIYDSNDIHKVIRYIGLSTVGIARWHSHMNAAICPTNKNYRSKKSQWIRDCNFEVTFDIVDIAYSDIELLELEKAWIATYKESNILYNQTAGGRGTRGYKHSDEARARRSGPGNPRYGYRYTDEEKLLHSQRLKGIQSREANGFYGKHHSDTTKEYMSESSHKRWHTSRQLVVQTCRWCYNSNPNGPFSSLQDINDASMNPSTSIKISQASKHSMHIRWHVKRNTKKDGCTYCDI